MYTHPIKGMQMYECERSSCQNHGEMCECELERWCLIVCSCAQGFWGFVFPARADIDDETKITSAETCSIFGEFCNLGAKVPQQSLITPQTSFSAAEATSVCPLVAENRSAFSGRMDGHT